MLKYFRNYLFRLLLVCTTNILSITYISYVLYAESHEHDILEFPSYFINKSLDSGIGFTGYLGHTVAWADYNQDGCMDLLISNTDIGSHNNVYLYENTCSGTFNKTKSVINFTEHYPIRTSNWADLNNDGYIDLLLGGIDVYMSPFVFINYDGASLLESSDLLNITREGAVNNIVLFDYDLNGHLDIFESTYNSYLYRNTGKDKYTDATFESGILPYMKNIKSAIAVDYNSDSFPDLVLLSRDYIRLLENQGNGTFLDISTTAKLKLGKGYRPSAVCAGDYNNDGHMDLYIVNISSPGNILFKNNGDGTFRDVTRQTRTSDVGDGRTCSFIDYNSDGYLDIFTTNHVNPSKLFRNKGNEKFLDVARQAGIDTPIDAFSVSWCDYNGDAILDVYLNGHIGTALYEGFNINKSVVIELIGDGINTNTSAIGSRIKLDTMNKSQIREIFSSKGCCENDMLPAHFGLGQETEFGITVNWTNGDKCKFEKLNVEDNRYYKVYQEGCRLEPN